MKGRDRHRPVFIARIHKEIHADFSETVHIIQRKISLLGVELIAQGAFKLRP